jgi:peptidoglycan/xylan/chitin deacetylase (PgdA/CDA1 family)
MDAFVASLRFCRKRLCSLTSLAAFFLSCISFHAPIRDSLRPLVVITFDDAHPTIYSFAFPSMRSMDSSWKATHFYPVSYMKSAENMTLDQVREMERAGWETGGHGISHENLSSIPIDTVRAVVKKSHGFLMENGLSRESFAYPFGNYNDTVRAVVAQYFKNIRTSHDFDYLDIVNREELGYYAVKSGCTASDVIGRVERAKTLGSPLVIIGFHVILSDSAALVPYYWCRESVFTKFLRYLKKQELPVVTLREAMRILCGGSD